MPTPSPAGSSLSTVVYSFAPITLAGTPESAPSSQALNFPPLEVVQVSWKVPPGPVGHLGWQLGASGSPIVPANAGEWIVTDDEENIWSLYDAPQTGSWTFIAYNTGTYDHTVYLRFLCVPLSAGEKGGSGLIVPLDCAALDRAAGENILVYATGSLEAGAPQSVRP